MRKDNQETYMSSAHEFYKWADKHPIELFEQFFGLRLKWYQKLYILVIHFNEKQKEKKKV
ncbi:hypothetical protein EBB07_28350 [Paenibacillaceae bacterium]|nr:hypothetical protein EBB07_28350 [Paenibacillaceae bacterium]